MSAFGLIMAKICLFFRKNIFLGIALPQNNSKIIRVQAFTWNKLFRYFLATNILQVANGLFLVCQNIWKLNCSSWIVPKISILGLKMPDLWPFLYLGKMPKIEPINIFHPVFAKTFLWLIWVTYSKMSIFGLKMAKICHFFEKIAFWAMPGDFNTE